MKTRTLLRSLLVVAALAVVAAPLTVKLGDGGDEPYVSVEANEAEAAGAGTASFGDFDVNYFTNGKTEISIVKGGQVHFYLVLTSAQTTTLRAVYETAATIPLASGGQTAGANDAVDGTTTLPSRPSLGDLSD